MLQNNLAKKALERLLTKEEAEELYNDLEKQTTARLKSLFGEKKYSELFPSKRHGDTWSVPPIGWVDHYTAAPFAKGTLLWFSNQPRNVQGNSSAHFVIDRDGFPFVIIPHTHVAFHARSANQTHFGCEMVCAGKLKKEKNQLYYLENIPLPLSEYKNVVDKNDILWHNFTKEQKLTNIVLKRTLIALYPSLKRENFVDHRKVDPTRKIDCGPLWPLEKINDLVFSGQKIQEEF